MRGVIDSGIWTGRTHRSYSGDRLTATTDYDATRDTEIMFLALPTLHARTEASTPR